MPRRALSVGPLAVAVLVAPVALPGCAGDTMDAWVASSELPSPAGPHSGEPFLTSSGEAAWLTWLERSPSGGHDLRLAKLEGSEWSEPVTVEHSERFFVNWADFPSITRAPDGKLWAHWLARGESGGYDYGVRVAYSADDGASWSEPVTLHDDASPTEHGFVSTLTWPDGIGFAWLDGRRFAPGPRGAEPTNEMTLRYRTFGPDGSIGPEELLDGRVCDCCQTAAALTDAGPIVVYRDRTEDEVRDVHVVRQVDGAWLEGRPVHADGWTIAGCPVNGPAVAARGMDVAVAWFTGAGDEPRAKVAFSSDGGASFGGPIVVDDGNPGGRVDVVLATDGAAYVTWLERTGGDRAEVRLRRVRPDGEVTPGEPVTASSAERASGFPRLTALDDGTLLIAWTDVAGDAARVRIARLNVR